jgi:type II restriction/modification system DNA methylase subunit YeeA
MNTNHIKRYAPQARQDFISAVGKRLNQFGIDYKNKTLSITEPVISGSIMQIGGNSFDVALAPARKRLVQRAEQLGFEQLVEQVAYTWFNRFCALRFMELKPDYLEHGFRVLSHPTKANSFEILDHAQDVADSLGLDRAQIVELRLAGNQDEALYRQLLLGQCHQLHQAMPFLFEALDDETELLLPDNLTRTDSILRGLVDDIPEEDWQQVEVIGWLYQFYISEKKDEVIGKVVKSEDIPAATQLFTPNWIVKYLVQNSVGRQWLMTYPDSALKAQMDNYITPAEQEPSVAAALAALTPTSLEPEAIKVIDPACGSGHILVEAYDLFKAIYEERGYRSRDIPKLILENNLFGLDIDDRAAQLAGFALMMKAREDDRRIFTRDIKLNVFALQSTQGLELPELWRKLNLNNTSKRGVTDSLFDEAEPHLVDRVDGAEFNALQSVLTLFEHAKTFGSLIQVPAEHADVLLALKTQLQSLLVQGDNYQRFAAKTLLPFVQQAWVLAQKYDAVIANPPYMGGKGMNPELKVFAQKHFPDSKSDLFAMFMERAFDLLKDNGYNAQVNMQSWMFLSSYQAMRENLLDNHTFITMAHLGARAFGQISGEVVQTTAFVLGKKPISSYRPTFFRLIEGNEEQKQTALLSGQNRFDKTVQEDLKKIPGSSIAYWCCNVVFNHFLNNESLGEITDLRSGISTGDNDRFYRSWWEVSLLNTNLRPDINATGKWFPIIRGGGFRRWHGNRESIINLENDGEAIYTSGNNFRLRNKNFYSKLGLTWSRISSGELSFRLKTKDVNFGENSPCLFLDDQEDYLLALLNTKVINYYLILISPTLSNQVVDVAKIPIIQCNEISTDFVNILVNISKNDWDTYETSWGYIIDPLIHENLNSIKHVYEDFSRFQVPAWKLEKNQSTEKNIRLEDCFTQWQAQNLAVIAEVQRLEQENNRLFIDAYGLQDELTPDVPLEQITLTVNPKYRYGGNLTDEQLAQRFQADTLAELISYAIGCMMGRYSLDEPGLIYAHAGNLDFDPARYQTFTADDDGVIPLTDQDWFRDDASNRFRDFVRTVWGEENLQANLAFIAESLCLGKLTAKRGEQSLETIRRYLSNQFYKDHLQTYKKRPIYWLFSSGKQKAFEGLVYLHRYNDSTLPRMRTEYVTPLLGKYEAFADQLKKQLEDASPSEATRLKKDLTALEKKQTELRAFDDKLKHYADRRIKLDLDDGVKVNYGKFGDLLAEVKAITGGKE